MKLKMLKKYVKIELIKDLKIVQNKLNVKRLNYDR